MFRRCSLLTLALGEAARMKTSQSAASLAASETMGMVMLENVAMASGFLNATEGAVANPMCDSLWNPELDKYFKDKRVWGSGATACVFGGVDETGTLVAIKVGKPTESIAGWRAECGEMQIMRMKACQSGEKSLALHEEYIPTCTLVGQTADKKANYYVMHAGGTVAYRDLPKEPLSDEQKKLIFAQLVGSIYALHRIDYTHNDLHGQNIVLNKEYKLALIDFGGLKSIAAANNEGYKRDGNAIWRWGSVVFGCGASADWVPDLPNHKVPTSERYSRAGAFNKCLKERGADDETLAVVKKMTDNCIKKATEQNVEALYNSKFVQSHLPQPKKYFPFAAVEGCLSWDSQRWSDELAKAEFSGHYKCETTPGWITERKKTRNGKTKIRKSLQCNVPTLSSACFTSVPGQRASCGGGLDMRLQCDSLPLGTTGGFYTGACLKENHAAYKFAKVWGE